MEQPPKDRMLKRDEVRKRATAADVVPGWQRTPGEFQTYPSPESPKSHQPAPENSGRVQTP